MSTSNTNNPFQDPSAEPRQPHVSDVGFGYVADNDPANHASLPPQTPKSPLKSALKSPGTARTLNPLSPTFREELELEKQERKAEKENERDLKIKIRVRAAKILLRGVNFSCSLIVLSLIAASLAIFNATKDLAARNNRPAWAIGTPLWPQYLMLALASFSVVAAVAVFWGYCKGGHRRAEKLGVYYSVLSVCFFSFTLILWVVAAALFQNSKTSNNGQDLWSWSCTKNLRAEYFADSVDYQLVCRMQDWVLICSIIEIVVEVFVILIYAVVFYRFYTKNRLRKTMNLRDKARNDLYLAQLRATQSAPNTPGFIPPKSPYINGAATPTTTVTQYASPTQTTAKPFQLQPPPARAQQRATEHSSSPTQQQQQQSQPPQSPASPPPAHVAENVNEHVGAAPGEQTFEAVPIPGAYTSPTTATDPSR